jgi:membrane protease subunit HflC
MFTRSGLLLILLALTMLGLSLSVYIVNEYEKAIVLRLGKLQEEKPAPGIHFKIPFFDQVKKFDGRVLTLDESAESFYTIQSKRLQVDSFAKWKIEDLDRYYIATGGSEGTARELLSARINNGLRNEFGQRTLHEVVSGERDQLMDNLVEKINETALLELGVDVVDIRVKKIDLPPEVRDSVYNRMRAAREKEAREYRSKGKEQAEVIRSAADREQIVIKANAYREAEQIRGTGDATATSTYADAYNRNPEFYSFLRSLNAYQSTFQSKSDILLVDPDSEFFRYLKDSQGGK